MTQADILQALQAQELEDNWETVLQNTVGLSEQQADELRIWIGKYRDTFLRQVESIDFEEGLSVAVALKYIEMKSQWIMANTQIQFYMFRGQDPDPETPARASLVTSVLQRIEGFLPEEDKDQIDTFLHQPLSSPDESVVRIDAGSITITGAAKVLIHKRA